MIEKLSAKLTVLLFILFLVTMAICFFVIPDSAFSEQENRKLQQLPEFCMEKLLSGEFTDELNTYCADQFPFRNSFLKLKSTAELLTAKQENNGVIYSRDQLAVRLYDAYESILKIYEDTDYYSQTSVSLQLQAYSQWADSVSVPIVTVIPPRTISVADSSFSYSLPDQSSISELASSILGESSGFLNVLPELKEAYERGEYVIYRTDHHWTTLGAYYAYVSILKQLGKEEEILPTDSFTIEEIPDFSGTTSSRGNFLLYRKDTVSLWHLEDDSDYSIVADGETLDGFYDMEKSKTHDKYATFLGGVHGLMTVTKEGVERPTMLIAKDSFADSLIPFLARSYNLVVVDLKTNFNLTSIIEQYDVDSVLVIYNEENLISTGALGNIH